MLIQIKPHSLFTDYFNGSSMNADFDNYFDIFAYLNGMHLKFVHFAKQQLANGLEEGFVFLDKNLNVLTYEELSMRKAKEGDVLHIVPTIVGASGKNGGILKIIAGVALFVMAPYLAGALSGALFGGATTVAAGASLTAGGVSVAAIGKNIAVSLILSGFVEAMTKSPASADSSSRSNDMFGSLTNSTTSDTSVAQHYGMTRVAGQFISGYILATEHSKADIISVGDSFE